MINGADIPVDLIEAMAMRARLRVSLAIVDDCIADGGANVEAWREERAGLERDLNMFILARSDLPD